MIFKALFLIPRILFWLFAILVLLWMTGILVRGKKESPKFVGIPLKNRFFPDTTTTNVSVDSFASSDHIDAKNGNQSKGEKLARTLFSEFYNQPFDKESRMLINPVTGRFLELDGYNHNLRLAYEYNGKHHYHDAKQGERDIIKRKLCDQRNIYLIPIPYHVSFAKMKQYIAALLPKSIDQFLVNDATREYVRACRSSFEQKLK